MAKYKKRADGRYCANVDFGRDLNGKRIRKMAYGKTIRELENNIMELKMQRASGQFVKNADTNFYEYAISWLETYQAMNAINTIAMYRNIIETHLKPEIGHLSVSEIQKSDIQRIITERKDHYETCNKIILTLKQIFNSAIDDEMITKSPVKNIAMPTKTITEKRPLTDLEKKAIPLAVFTPMQACFVYIAFYCGLRREELLALTKNDFDFKQRTVSVSKAIIFDKNNPVLTVPKTPTSIRIVPIPSDGFDKIKAFIESTRTLYLFTKRDGNLMTHSSYVKFWAGIVKALNRAVMTENEWEIIERLPEKMRAENRPIHTLTAHIFRHNYATMLYYSGISMKKAAALMGHSNTNMIMKIYAHLDEEKEKAVEKLDENIRLAP